MNVSKKLFTGLLVCILVSCSENNNLFIVEGEIRDAGDKTLYLENIGVSTITFLDSVKVGQNGSFKFKQKRPNFPDFYRLRLENQFINFAVDSTETLRINGDAAHFARNYTIEGSPESEKIKELTLLQLSANTQYNQLQKRQEAKDISTDEYIEQVTAIIETYKTAARKYIYDNPLSPSAYYALFQQINNLLIFDPYDKTDSKAFGAVANNWNQYYPDSPRSAQLYSLFTNSLAILRGDHSVKITEGNSKELFDISLPSPAGKEIRLSDVGDRKFTLIDFTAYSMNTSPVHNILLAEIYDKYKSKGFEIYQISLDADDHFWKNASANLPWISVRDPQSVQSDILKKFNISELPTSFIRNREGEIIARVESYDNLEKEIANYLK